MTRRSIKYNIINHENDAENVHSKSSLLCNGYPNRSVTRQSSQELLKVQCNGLTVGHRSSKLLSPSGSDVLPLPTSTKRCTRRASASWCGSTRELSQLSPTDSEIENVVRENSLDPSSDSLLDPKGQQLWLPVAAFRSSGTACGVEEIENNKATEPFVKFSAENGKPSSNDSNKHGGFCRGGDCKSLQVFRCDDSCRLDSSSRSYDGDRPIKKDPDDYDDDEDDDFHGKMNSDRDGNDGKTRGTSESLTSGDEQDGNDKKFRVTTAAAISAVQRRRKKLSPEEKLLQDNKEYFKMEVLNTKLRSSGSLANATRETEYNEVEGDAGEKIGKIIIKKIKMRGRQRKSRWTKSRDEDNPTSSDCDFEAKIFDRKNRSTGVKINGIIRRKRQSELMTLCDEAESFMFGDCSRHGRGNAVASAGPEFRSKTATSVSVRRTFPSPVDEKETGRLERSKGDGESVGGSPAAGKRRKKRRSHAEAFIHDNIDYYKFETPDSRLRYQNPSPSRRQSSIFSDPAEAPNLPSCSKSVEIDLVYTLNSRTKRKKVYDEQNKSRHLVGTDEVPVGETVVATAEIDAPAESQQERKVNSSRIAQEISNLTFSFESVPLAEPWYDVYKRQDEGMENYYPILSDPNDEPFLLPYELPKPGFTKLVPDEASEYYKRKKRKFGRVLSNHPRKSPRCHASTLAILSSLKKRKRRSGTRISLVQQQQQTADPVVSSCGSFDSAFESFFPFPQEQPSSGAFEYDEERIILEPSSDSESKKSVQDISGCLSKMQQEEIKCSTGSRSRSKKLTKSCCNDVLSQQGGKHFLLRNIETDLFFKDMIIETGKKSDLNINIATVLENLKSGKNADATHSADHSDFDNASSVADEPNLRRKRRKCRKINKTGWDNAKKSRRNKLTINKMTRVKPVTCGDGAGVGDASAGQESTKTKSEGNDCPRQDTTLSVDKRFSKRVLDIRNQKNCRSIDRTKTRSQQPDEPQVTLDRCGGGAPSATTTRKPIDRENEIHSRSESCDSRNSLEYSPCVVRVKKINQVPLNASVKLRCSNGRYSIQSKRLVLSRKKKRVMDYAWTTRKRRR